LGMDPVQMMRQIILPAGINAVAGAALVN